MIRTRANLLRIVILANLLGIVVMSSPQIRLLVWPLALCGNKITGHLETLQWLVYLALGRLLILGRVILGLAIIIASLAMYGLQPYGMETLVAPIIGKAKEYFGLTNGLSVRIIPL